MSRHVRAAFAVAVFIISATGCSSFRTRVLMNEGNKLYKAQKFEEAIRIRVGKGSTGGSGPESSGGPKSG